VAAGGGDLERTLGHLLSLDVAEVDVEPRLGAEDRLDVDARRRDRALAAQELEGLGEGGHCDHVDALDDRRLGRVVGRHEQAAQPARPHRCRHRQRAAHGLDAAVERELAEAGVGAQRLRRQLAAGGQHAERDRQVERGPVLLHVGRRQIHRDAPRRHLVAAVLERRAHPVLALPDGALGQPDDGEARHALAEIDLDLDQQPIGPPQRARQHRCLHCAFAAPLRV
jgi:hypothetical protein